MFHLIDWLQAEVLVIFTMLVLIGIPLVIVIIYLINARKNKKSE